MTDTYDFLLPKITISNLIYGVSSQSYTGVKKHTQINFSSQNFTLGCNFLRKLSIFNLTFLTLYRKELQDVPYGYENLKN